MAENIPVCWIGLSLPVWQKYSLLSLGLFLIFLSLVFIIRNHKPTEDAVIRSSFLEIRGGWTVIFVCGLACAVIALCAAEDGEFWVSGKLAGNLAIGDGIQQHRAAMCPNNTKLIGGACQCGDERKELLGKRKGNVWYCECGEVPSNGLEVAVAKCLR